MKKITLMLFATLFASLASAATNPWLRICRQSGGVMWVANDPNQPALCLLGSSAIGAEALFIYKTGGGTQQAISAYLAGEKNCPSEPLYVSSNDGQEFYLCQYQDGSVTELTTLLRGIGAAQNGHLDSALQQ